MNIILVDVPDSTGRLAGWYFPANDCLLTFCWESHGVKCGDYFLFVFFVG